MIRAGDVQVWLATAPVDLRKSFDSLAEHVRAFLGHDPLGGSLFIFRNRSGQRVKVLWFDQRGGEAAAGLVIYYKRLEKGTFRFPASDRNSVAISSAQLLRLLDGMEVQVPQKQS